MALHISSSFSKKKPPAFNHDLHEQLQAMADDAEDYLSIEHGASVAVFDHHQLRVMKVWSIENQSRDISVIDDKGFIHLTEPFKTGEEIILKTKIAAYLKN